MVRSCMGYPALPFVGEPIPDDLPETVPCGYGGCLRQGVHTKQRENGARIWSGTAENPETAALWLR